jgi:phosphopantothenoylcysteine synthetase/decarboxylase
VDPEEGYLSCGEVGPGRMASPEKILQVIQEQSRLLNRSRD